MKLDEAVQLVEYDPAWPAQYRAEVMRIRYAVEPARAVEHIGSTAAPGIALAKPVIDIMVGASPACWPEIRARLTALGYEDCDEAGVPERIYLRRREGVACNIALVEYEGRHWRNNLAIRERLGQDPVAAREYCEAKRRAWADSGGQLLAYSAGKHSAIEKMLRAARSGPHDTCEKGLEESQC